MKDGMESNVHVQQDISKLMEHANNVILTLTMFEESVNAILVSTEKVETNASDAMEAAENVKGLDKINVFLALMSVSHLLKKVEKLVHAADLTIVQLVSTVSKELKEDVSLAHHIVQLVFLKPFVKLAFLDSKWTKWNIKEPNILIVSKSVVTEEDSNLTVMMETKRMVMVAMKIVRSKQDGIVKELQLKNQAFAWTSNQIDHISL